MANIHDTLHPVTSPSDNLYPNINPVVNIPDESIPKRKMAFPIDSNGVTALIPTGTYVDIADLGIPGQVRFPSGTRYVYVQGGDVIVTSDLGEDKIYGPGVTPEWKFEIIVYSKNSDSYIATRFNAGDNPVASVEDDDFVVMILMLSPVETGPQVIPIYSIIPFEFIRYNTQPYEKQLAQTMGIAAIDGSYADLGAGKDVEGNVISKTYAKQTGSYPNLGAGKDGEGNVISSTYAKVGELSNETQLRTATDQAIMALIDDIEDGTTTVAKAETATTATTAETATTATTAETANTAATATKATQDGDGNVIATTYAKKSDIPTATRLYQHNVTIKNGDDAIITTTVLTSTSDVFSSVDDLITILGNEGFSVSSGPKLLPACGTVITAAGDTSVVYPVVGVGKYGNRVDAIGFYYFRQDVSVGRAGFQLLMNSSITYFNDTITQI